MTLSDSSLVVLWFNPSLEKTDNGAECGCVFVRAVNFILQESIASKTGKSGAADACTAKSLVNAEAGRT
jgi:hypothetical protein